MVTYEEFKEYMRRRGEEEIGERATVKKVKKLNGLELDGLCIMTSDCNISPTVYLNGYYDEFKNLKEPDEEALEIIWDSIKEMYYQHLPVKGFDAEEFIRWDSVKHRLRARLINTERNKELLEEMVSFPFMDLSIIFAVDVCIGNGMPGSVMVRESHADMWCVSPEEIYEAAMINMKDDWFISPISEILNKLRGTNEFDDVMYPINMYVIGNQQGIYGASVILLNEVMEHITALAKNKVAYIIPSSVNEVIMIIGDDIDGTESINKMIVEINSTVLDEMDILSDHVYVYNDKEHKLVHEKFD